MDIEELIKQAEELKSVPYNSPRVELWEKRTNDFVQKNYGKDYVEILHNALFFSQAIMGESHGQQMHVEAMTKAIELLESLKNEPTNITTTKLQVSQNSNNDYPIEKLNKLIFEKCKSLFANKEYSESVEKGFKVVRDRLRKLTGHETGSEAFGKGNIHIKGAAAQHVDEDFNKGVKFLTMAIDKFRNEKSHTADGNIDNPQRAYEYLVLCSLAMNLLDNAEIVSRQ